MESAWIPVSRMVHSFIAGASLAVLLPAIVAAQQIQGVVVEDSTKRPIAEVRIELLAADGTVRDSTLSTSTGWFELSARSGGEFVLRASHPAYTSVATIAVTVDSIRPLTVVLRLSGGPIPLEPVIAKGIARDPRNAYRERARRGAFGRFITRADIDRIGGYTISHILRMTPEVRIERVMDGAFVNEGVFMRSFGDLCVPSVYLDGTLVPTGLVISINDLLSAEEVEGIEVYRSSLTAPLEFRAPAFGSANEQCGVIVLWSRQLPRLPLTLKRIFFTAVLVSIPSLVLNVLQ
jgi:hypothetical protein